MIENIKKHKNIIILILAIIIIGVLIYYSSYSMSNLPEGEYIKGIDSPTGDYTLKAYLINSHATVDFSIRVELVNNSTSKGKNVYYEYHQSEVEMIWVDNDIVKINGKKLNIHNDIYDWRRE